jgi:hypothetical protein
MILIVTLPLKHYYHHLLIDFFSVDQANLLRKVDDERTLMDFEELNVFEK